MNKLIFLLAICLLSLTGCYSTTEFNLVEGTYTGRRPLGSKVELGYVEQTVIYPDGRKETFIIHGAKHENLKALDVAGKALDIVKPMPTP